MPSIAPRTPLPNLPLEDLEDLDDTFRLAVRLALWVVVAAFARALSAISINASFESARSQSFT